MYTAFEPLQTNRFAFYVDGIPSYLIKKASAPGVDMGEIKLDHINVYRKIKGKALWRDLNLSLYAPISPSGQQAIMEWVRLHHESATGRDGYSDFYKKDTSLVVLDPVGAVVSEWIVKGAFIKSVNFGELDFATAEPLNMDMVLGMDYCLLNF
jgi:hypothetical protein